MKIFFLLSAVGLLALPFHAASLAEVAIRKPNVLFIAIDDLNDWIGCMGGHPQTITPNLDRLAASGVLFVNAHCPAPACNPSRSAIFTGRSPHRSGLYDNRQPMREVMPNEVIMPQSFRNNGYYSAGSVSCCTTSSMLRHGMITFQRPSRKTHFPPLMSPKSVQSV